MLLSPLHGLSLLIVEDVPLIAMDIAAAFEDSGAQITTTNTLRHALILIEHDGLSGVILDHSLGNDSSSLLYRRLKERGIPFIVYSGLLPEGNIPADVPHILKPATHNALIAAMTDLIAKHPRPN
jgi:CheY-like chemotaxis protein